MKSVQPLDIKSGKEYVAVKRANAQCDQTLALLEIRPDIFDEHGMLKEKEDLKAICPICKTESTYQPRQMIRLLPRR